MKRAILLSAISATLLTSLLCSCKQFTGNRHYYAQIINNSDYTVVVTGSWVVKDTLINSLEPDVSLSWVFQDGAPPVAPHFVSTLNLAPTYFEEYNGKYDRLRLYFIDENVFDAAGGDPRNINPWDYLGYIDLSSGEAAAANWTIRFPDETINNTQPEQ